MGSSSKRWTITSRMSEAIFHSKAYQIKHFSEKGWQVNNLAESFLPDPETFFLPGYVLERFIIIIILLTKKSNQKRIGQTRILKLSLTSSELFSFFSLLFWLFVSRCVIVFFLIGKITKYTSEVRKAFIKRCFHIPPTNDTN